MPILSEITPVILTFNEAPNIERTLRKLEWAREVILVDSFSTDNTENIVRRFPNAVFVQRRFDSHSQQWNFGLEQVRTDWVLSLDADYIVPDDLREEISQVPCDQDVAAYYARFKYCIAGRPLRGNILPPRAILFRRSQCRYVQDGHTELLTTSEPTRFLKGYILHDDRKPLSRWLQSQRNYATLEAEHLLGNPGREWVLADRLRLRIWPALPAVFLYTLIVKRCLFDGWPGLFYALQRTYCEALLSLELLDRQLGAGTPPEAGSIATAKNPAVPTCRTEPVAISTRQ